MNDVETYGIGTKLVKEAALKEIRKKLVPGKYKIDRMVHVQGELTVNKDELATPTYTLLTKASMAKVLASLGCTRENVVNALIKVAKEKIEGKETPASPEYLEAIEKGELALDKMIAALPLVKKFGKVLGHLSMTEVVFAQVTDEGAMVLEGSQKKSA